MTDPTGRFRELFLELFESLPRQGPGSRACAERAFGLCRGLPRSPAIVDLGCGTGGQTLHLAELAGGPILALDSHAPSIARLRATVGERGLARRILPLVGALEHPPLRPGAFDLIWSEGALYNIGLEPALRLCRGLLRPAGQLAFTEPVWRINDPPREARASFEQDYPAMGRTADVLAALERAGFELLGHFPLPDAAWWGDFYTPLERRIQELRLSHAGDAQALAALDRLAQEPQMHRRHSDSYAYEFFVARRG